MKDIKRLAGGDFLLGKTEYISCFFPEDLSEEHKIIMKTASDFISKEVMPKAVQIEQKDESLMRYFLLKAGELGLLASDITENDGGLGMDKVSGFLIAEAAGISPSWATTMMAHIGIGTLPIVLYGNESQKLKYLPSLLSGQKMSAYCLTEAGAGSDAINGCRSKAVLSDDGEHYILNGEKIFISNGGWADMFIVFARIDNTDFSAFIVERSFSGVSSGPEEGKMGLHGSSTTTVIFEDVMVPKENLLHKPGKGHHIAMNVLNIGRFKLGAAATGGCKNVLKLAATYTSQRRQFGKTICEFGMIQEKLANLAYMAYLNESLNYRTVGLFDSAMSGVESGDADGAVSITAALREFAVECAISKVFGSEAIDAAVDELVQIHGGYGYVSDFPVERYYRDARVNRIYEGTNEINRLFITGELLKRAVKGDLALMAAGAELKDFLVDYSPLMFEPDDSPLAYQAHMLEMIKKSVLLTAGATMERFGRNLADEQEILRRLADMIIWSYALDSGLIRAQKAIEANGLESARFHEKAIMAAMDHMIGIIELWAREILLHCGRDDEMQTMRLGLKKILKYQPIDRISLNRDISQMVIAKGDYPLYI
jgi:alkylation response protein AidB-like acyl-CoA dehydrogenase